MSCSVPKIRIFIVEDHPIFRIGLENLLKENPNYIIEQMFSSGKGVLEAVVDSEPEILLLDIDLPYKSGIQIANELKSLNLENTKIIFVTSNKSHLTYQKAIKAGAKGYLLKDNAIEDLFECIDKVTNELIYISPLLERYLVETKKEDLSILELDKILTKSEKRILKLVSQRYLSKEIADMLYVSPKTVENHRSNICKKLTLTGTNSLLTFAINHKDDFNY